ncbi:hypothetical protein T439DRAFT_351115 [Meredithblackwellia eburnea MCA 4105]
MTARKLAFSHWQLSNPLDKVKTNALHWGIFQVEWAAVRCLDTWPQAALQGESNFDTILKSLWDVECPDQELVLHPQYLLSEQTFVFEVSPQRCLSDSLLFMMDQLYELFANVSSISTKLNAVRDCIPTSGAVRNQRYVNNKKRKKNPEGQPQAGGFEIDGEGSTNASQGPGRRPTRSPVLVKADAPTSDPRRGRNPFTVGRRYVSAPSQSTSTRNPQFQRLDFNSPHTPGLLQHTQPPPVQDQQGTQHHGERAQIPKLTYSPDGVHHANQTVPIAHQNFREASIPSPLQLVEPPPRQPALTRINASQHHGDSGAPYHPQQQRCPLPSFRIMTADIPEEEGELPSVSHLLEHVDARLKAPPPVRDSQRKPIWDIQKELSSRFTPRLRRENERARAFLPHEWLSDESLFQ